VDPEENFESSAFSRVSNQLIAIAKELMALEYQRDPERGVDISGRKTLDPPRIAANFVSVPLFLRLKKVTELIRI
jgi:hypothetical protein